MKSAPIIRPAVILIALLLGGGTTSAKEYAESGFYAGETGLTPSERAGREIWYKATVGNDRFHTYVFQQRIGVLIDWFRVLNAREHGDRFKAWGLINDPDCCIPGTPDCPAKSLEETFGFEWCPGDEELLKFVGRPGYRDPACDFKDAPLLPDDPHGPQDQRQSPCDLKFGTSTGALGLRKFPNPRFDLAAWKKLNGGKLDTWEGYNKKLSMDPENTDSQISHLLDGSVEPPFRIGMACGACHIAFNPLNPPEDPANPKWENLLGAIGNQYARVSEILASGMPTSSLEWQVFAHARPGTTDTSAVPTDQVNNPGSQNQLINLVHRPTFDGEKVLRWRKVKSCDKNESDRVCWCEPGRENKCWRRSLEEETVHHILKGGGDSIGALGAVQRVYFNIGSCSEQCWVNHLTDLRVLDPTRRNFGQTPMDIGQCRRDCASFRAMEDRLHNVADFLFSPKAYATDLVDAIEHEHKKEDPNTEYSYDDLVDDLEKHFGENAVAHGEKVFAQNCARCHSSQNGSFEQRDFRKTVMVDNNPERVVRVDWLGNDESTPATEVGTFRCRALHSNHMKGHIWEEFASETYHARPDIPDIREPSDGGRGYYRNISLVNLWAHAPFMHNNAIGPEICGKPNNKANDFYSSPYVDETHKPAADAPDCLPYDPSVKGRFQLYVESMRALLNPDKRKPKVTLLNEDIVLDIGPKLWDAAEQKQHKVVGITLRVPKGTPAGALGNFQHKQFVIDLVQSKLKPEELGKRLTRMVGREQSAAVMQALKEIRQEIIKDPENMLTAINKRMPLLLDVYSSCTAEVENVGHRFGEDLSDQDKNALIAFLATL